MGLADGQHEERLERYILETAPPFFLKELTDCPPGPLAGAYARALGAGGLWDRGSGCTEDMQCSFLLQR